MNEKSLNWDNFFEEINELVLVKDESRKVYDHYEKKLEKLVEKKTSLTSDALFNPNTKFYKQILRNQEKYIKSKEDYIQKAIVTFDTIEKLNYQRYMETNPLLLKVLNLVIVVIQFRNEFI